MSDRLRDDMVACLRARGFSREQIAEGLHMRRDIVDKCAYRGDHLRETWSIKRAADEVMFFHRTFGRWPMRTEFCSRSGRSGGLPSWGQIDRVMWGALAPPWSWQTGRWTYRFNRLEELELRGIFQVEKNSPGRNAPANGWVMLQGWLVVHRKLTLRQILDLPNLLVRRRAIEIVGWDKFLKAPGVEILSSDRYGTLFRLPGESANEPLTMLEVTNKTKEPDGTFAKYYLRVAPHLTNAKQAVAWSFGREGDWRSFSFAKET